MTEKSWFPIYTVEAC